MADTARRSSSLPHRRATALFARTIYRELRRARYEQEDLLRFVSDLMEVMTTAMHKERTEWERAVEGVIDPETGLPNRAAFREILDFEIRRVDEGAGTRLLLFCVDVEVPAWCSDDVARTIHEITAKALQRCVRADDVVARLPPNRYVLLLRNAESSLVLPLCARLGAGLHDAWALGSLPAGVRFGVRWGERTEAASTGAEFLEHVVAAPAIPLGIVEEHHPAASVNTDELLRATATATAKAPSPKAARRVVLALSGGAVRAGAHVGVMDVLKEAGVEIAGIAGTSAGALVGAMALSGMSHDAIVERFSSFASSKLYQELRSRYAGYIRHANRSRATTTYFRQSELAFMSDKEVSAIPDDLYAELIAYFVGEDRDIAALSRPFAACATDIVEGRPASYARGPLHQALRASCATPGLFAPQVDGERLLVDGSTVSEVPTAAALALRVPSASVLAVYLERSEHDVSRFTSSAEVFTRTAALVHTALVREQLRSAPLLITVPVRGGGWLDLRKTNEMRRVGAVVTRVALEGLLVDLDRAVRAT